MTKKRELLGATLWALTVQYFIAEFIVASAWKLPRYDFRLNFISDLGATVCPTVAPGTNMIVCSPLHMLMDASFVTSGLLIISGAVLLRSVFPPSRVVTLGLAGLAIGSLGLIGVGLLPENLHEQWHVLSATFFFLTSNASLVVLGLRLTSFPRWKLRGVYTALSGTIALLGLVVFIQPALTARIGVGYVERVIAYPFTIWLVVMGLYLLLSRAMTPKPAQY
jgi:hypothetical membrane protein